ncbi:MAG: hypothetical protein ABIN67_19025 [Ferruginibacter sp.]
MKILTSLAEHHYFLGLSALINSVVKNGTYVDKIIIGYRGPLPRWLPPLKTTERGQSCTLTSGLEMELIEMKKNVHMVHEKPKWFQYVSEVLEPDASEFFFFDSDIVILNRMSFFGEWVEEGVALCEDVNNDMNHDHPIRKQWVSLAQQEGCTITNPHICGYYNSGFIGWTRENAGFIDDWVKSFDILAQKSGDMRWARVQDRTHTVLSTNQDSLNLAAMITRYPISTIGPEAMGFRFGLSLMSHPIGSKPWKRSFVKEFMKGVPPRVSDVIFWENISGTELQPCSISQAKRRAVLCKSLRGMARFYKREYSA